MKTRINYSNEAVGGLPKIRDSNLILVQILSEASFPVEEFLDSCGLLPLESILNFGKCQFFDAEIAEKVLVHYRMEGEYTRPVVYGWRDNCKLVLSGIVSYKVDESGKILDVEIGAPVVKKMK
jgi:hypothetical protein